MAIEPIETGHDFKAEYRRALVSGREQFMMNVSGYSLDRVREDRKKHLAGYDIFAKDKAAETPEPYRKPRHNNRNRTVKIISMAFANEMHVRMNKLGINVPELAALARLSNCTISDIRNGQSNGSHESRKAITEAFDKYEAIRAVFFKQAAAPSTIQEAAE